MLFYRLQLRRRRLHRENSEGSGRQGCGCGERWTVEIIRHWNLNALWDKQTQSVPQCRLIPFETLSRPRHVPVCSFQPAQVCHPFVSCYATNVPVSSAWFAFFLPCYATFKVLSHRPVDVAELQKYAMYWSVIGTVVAFEYVAEWLISWHVP